MIELSFITGSALRKVHIDGRKIDMISQETGFVPMTIDLDKINDSEVKEKMGEDGVEFIKVISKLDTEQQMMDDIKKDFQATGWRLIKTKIT